MRSSPWPAGRLNPTATLSSTDRFWNSRMFWNVRAMPVWQISTGGRPSIRLPAIWIVPALGL